MLVAILTSLSVGLILGVLFTFNGLNTNTWDVRCKYCHRYGHSFRRCSDLNTKQKDALEVLYNEDHPADAS